MDRKLTAILYADVAGYSRLTGLDEEGTHQTLKVHLGLLTETIQNHSGRICHFAGDAVLAEFASVVTAVSCAVKAQRELAGHNEELPEDRKLQFRIGVNLGDVIVDGDEIYGNGVNVAARLESLAEPGGICVSGRVLDQVEKNVDVGFAYLGSQSVKNIEKPVNAYKVLMGPDDAGKIVGTPERPPRQAAWRRYALGAAALAGVVVVGGVGLWYHGAKPDLVPAAVAKMDYPLPDKPSVAVLPFENFSGEERDGFIARGLTEDIINALSNVPELFVISRTSSFAFEDKPFTVGEIAEALGVRYIVEGSIQRSGDGVRINTQLVDAVEGNHLWADKFDGETEDLFVLQDEIVRHITIELQIKLTFGDIARVAARGTNNLDAWLLRVQAATEVYKFTRESTARARELSEMAYQLDPYWARPVATIAWSYWFEARQGWTDDREAWIRKGIEFAEKAIEMDANEPLGYMQLANLVQLQGEHDRAVALREKAVELAPNDMAANWGLGTVLYRAGEAERGVEVLKRAERVAPRHPVSLLWGLQEGQFLAGQFEESIETGKRAVARNPNRDHPHVLLVAAYGASGRLEEAQAGATKVLELNPKFTVGRFILSRNYKNQEDASKLRDLLVKAGLPS